jgi:phage terminase large subunit-like protein
MNDSGELETAAIKEERKRLLAEKLARMERERAFSDRNKEMLPHIYGWKWYPWARRFLDSTNQMTLLCAANQISKSSTQIRKAITWATDQTLWSKLWRNKPVQFWYLYPSQPVVNAEFLTKWKQFMPKDDMKNDPKYGWKEIKDGKDTLGIEFNSGVYLFFKTYSKNAQNLQTGTCDAIFCDEELPFELYDELIQRISATDGYFSMVFTATLGQEEWRRAMEPKNAEEEMFPNALKMTVSLYDAMYYDDGSASYWTLERIQKKKALCGTEADVQKRIYGRFIVVGGRVYESFDITRHMKLKHPIPKTWQVYEGVDIGSGGVNGHPSAIVFVAVRPDMREGRVFLGWRGDNVATTAGDVATKHLEMKRANNLFPVEQRYDWGNPDFFQIATSMGETFHKANKSHDVGFGVVNTLFKNDMLFIYEDEELAKLGGELSSLQHATVKRHAKDDFADALRYCVATIPWDFSWLTGNNVTKVPSLEEKKADVSPEQKEINDRRAAFFGEGSDESDVEQEFAEWNDLYNG